MICHVYIGNVLSLKQNLEK